MKKYNLYIELIRVVAINMIILYHIGLMISGDSVFIKYFKLISNRFWPAVDIFLIISGYYFYKSFSLKYDNNFIKYFTNRIIRIVPGYFLFLIIYFPWGLYLERFIGNNFRLPNGQYAIHFFTFTANLPMAFGKWSGVALEGFFGLCILMQLFLLFSFIFHYIRSTKNRLIILFLFEIVALLLRALPVFREDIWTSYFFTFTRDDSFIAGIMLAILLNDRKYQKILAEYRYHFLIPGIVLTITVAVATDFISLHNIRTSFLGFPAIAIILFLIFNWIFQLNKKNTFFYSGDYVYSIFLIRLPAIYFIIGFIDSYFIKLLNPYIIMITSFIMLNIWGVFFYFLRPVHIKIDNLIRKIIKT